MGYTHVQHSQQRVRDTRGDRRLTWASARAFRHSALALAIFSLLLLPSVALAATPHGNYAPALPTGSSKCAQCHRPHRASTTSGLLSIDATTGVVAQTALCLKCHGYAGPAINAAASFEPVLPGGHRVEDATGTVAADLTNECSGCHEPHSAAKGLPRAEINGQDVSRTVDANSWCWACHDPALTKNWSGLTGAAYFDRLFQPSSMDASGYPMVGTLRGTTAYQAGAHASIPASATVNRAAGDCLWCHSSHRSPNARDGLLAAFGPTAPGDPEADLCFRCHDEAVGGYGTGHLIRSADASLTAGSPVPCYECHNAHGSMNGNTALISDALGQGLNPKSSSTTYTVETLSQFCFTCHTSAEGYWWDSENGVMAPPEDIALAPRQSVVGIDRLGGVLRLPDGPAAHTKDDLSGCSCHGGAVHSRIGRPVSNGGQSCYMCHSSYEDTMEAGGADSTTVYHHVMGTGAGDGDTAFPDGSYPTGTDDLYCMSCHADHDQFNGALASNLRADLSSAATTAATDYLPTAPYGICVSCHAVSLAKDPGQASDDMTDTDTPAIAGGTAPGGFGASAHSYAVDSTFSDATAFSANCSKCHNDEQLKRYQEGVLARFGTHFSAVRRLLSAFGGTPTDPLGEQHCYGCHSEPGDIAGGKSVAEAGRDYYGVASMSALAEDVHDQFQLTGSTHPVQATATGSVECESCHNAHTVTSAAPVSDPANTYNLASYETTTQQKEFCLSCHRLNGGPKRDVGSVTYVPYDVTMGAPDMDKYINEARGHWNASGSIGSDQTVACGTCHDNHGSDYEKLLGARDVVTGTNRINGQAIGGNDNSVCYACHTGASTSYPSFAREAGTGYAMNGTWPGKTMYTEGPYPIHQTLGASADGDCKVCHDVHGTANTYDELTGTFTAVNYTLCFSCHNASAVDAGDNIQQWYPTSAGGTQPVANNNYGHKGTDGGTPADRVMPCYNCHNPHGSTNAYGLQVVTQVTAGVPLPVTTFSTTPGAQFSPTTAAQVRAFCFTCHVQSNTNNGWNGSAYAAVAAGASVDGFDRLTQLKILDNRAAHRSTSAANCYDNGAGCHNNGPHYPEN